MDRTSLDELWKLFFDYEMKVTRSSDVNRLANATIACATVVIITAHIKLTKLLETQMVIEKFRRKKAEEELEYLQELADRLFPEDERKE